jgi:hypothetical protein
MLNLLIGVISAFLMSSTLTSEEKNKDFEIRFLDGNLISKVEIGRI